METCMSALKDYIDSDDPNYFWRLSSGQHENLVDSAIEHIDRQQALLHQIFTDITKDNRLSPDTFDRLVEAVKK